MRVDRYTRVILTIIAACLVWMCVGGIFSTQVVAHAPQEVVIVGVRGERTVLAVRPAQDWYEAALPVEAPRPLGTRVMGIERGQSARWDALDVTVREQAR